MRFWDASAHFPLLVDEGSTAALIELYRKEPAVLAWWGSTVECASTIAFEPPRRGRGSGSSGADAALPRRRS